MIAATAVLVLCAAAAVAVARAVVADPGWITSTQARLEGGGALKIGVHGAVEVKLLPRPIVVAQDVTIDDRLGTLALRVPTVQASLSLFELLRGRAVLDRIQLIDVAGSVDADLAARQFVISSDPPTEPAATDPVLPSRITVVSGLVEIVSQRPGMRGFLSDIRAAADGLSGGAATLSGTASWHGERGELSGRLDSVAQFFAGRAASGSIRLKSRLVSASATGAWGRGWRGGFQGAVTASSPALSSLLRVGGLSTGVLAGIGQISFSGTAEPSENGVAFASSHLAINGDTLEGSFGLQTQEGRLTLVGTLATDELDLTPLASVLPSLRGHEGGWSLDAIPFSPADLHDMDLRISAGHLKLKGLEAEDAGLSVLCRNGRMELSLGEARAYGGMIKGRLFSNADAADLALKLDASWSQVDLQAVAKAVPGLPDNLTGAMSGSIMAEGRGLTASALVRNLEGRGQASWHRGTVETTPVLDALLRTDAGTEGEAPAATLSFDLATLEFRISDGNLVIGKAALTMPQAQVTVSGQTSLPHQTYVLSSTSTPPGQALAAASVAPVRRVAGLWGGPVHQIGTGRDGAIPRFIEPASGGLSP